MHRRIRSGESGAGKLSRQRRQPFPVGRVIRSSMGDQNGLVILRPPSKKGCNKRNPETPALVAEQIGQARSLVVFILGEIRVGELTHWNKQWRDAQPLDGASECYVPVVRAQIKASEVPHGEGKDEVSGEN